MASESRSAVPRGHIDPDYRVVIALREVTLRLNVVGAEFAAGNHLHTTDLRAIIELLDAERMGHTAMSGPEGALKRFARAKIGRRIFIHINNSNPALIAGSPETRSHKKSRMT